MEKTISKASGYSLWLVPDTKSEVYRVLTQCIADIAKEHQTFNFVPHTTLLGGVVGFEEDIRNKTRKLAEMIAPYYIELGEVGSNGIYFQILFSKVEQTEMVMRANIVAQKVFAVEKGKYFPHASLAYGDFPSETIVILQQQIRERQHSITGKKFLVRDVELWRTEGEVKDWYKVAIFPFKS